MQDKKTSCLERDIESAAISCTWSPVPPDSNAKSVGMLRVMEIGFVLKNNFSRKHFVPQQHQIKRHSKMCSQIFALSSYMLQLVL